MVSASFPGRVRFRYVAVRGDGRKARGVLTAEDEQKAAAILLDQGLSPLRLTVQTGTGWRSKHLSAAEFAPACRCMATLFSVGAPADRMLRAAVDISQGRVRSLLEQAQGAVREGQSLSAALTSSEFALPPLVADMVLAGEEGGRLGDTLTEVASHLEFEAESRARLRSALAYPGVVAIVGAVSLGLVVLVVIPRFAELFSDVAQEMPPAARLVMSAATFFRARWPVLLVVFAAVITTFEVWRRRGGQARIDAMLGRLPVVGSIRSAFATARVCRSIGSLLRTGVSLPRALRATAHAAGDTEIAERLFRAGQRIERGDSITSSFQVERVVLPVASQLIAVGEQGGTLDAMLLKAGDLASEHGSRRLQALLTVIEPLLIVVFGGLIALVAMTLLGTIYSLRPGL